MKIVDIRDEVVGNQSSFRNAYVDFSQMTVSVVAVVTDVIRDGRPVVGYGFNSTGRYGCQGLLRERFIPSVLAAEPDELLDEYGSNFDPAKVWATMMTNEKPGGHGERPAAVGVIDIAMWDAVAKIYGAPLWRLLADRYHGGMASERVWVYAAGGYYYPDDGLSKLSDEMRSYLDRVYRAVKLKIGAGQFKAHFLRQETNSSARQQMVERSLSNEFFNIDRVIGMWAEGNPTSWTYYSIGVNNGYRSLNRSIDTGIDHSMAIVGKFDLVVLGEWEKYSESDLKRRQDPFLSFGVSGATDANNSTDGATDPEYKTYQFAADATFKYKGFSLFGEYVGRWLDYEKTPAATDPDISSGSNTYAHGFNVQGGYFLTEFLEATARCSVVYGNEGFNDGTAFEAGPGFNWFINGHKVKLQTDVMFFDIPRNMPRASSNLQRSGPQDPPNFVSSASRDNEGEQGVMWRTQLQISF